MEDQVHLIIMLFNNN